MLVTGATGGLGRNLVTRLVKDGHTVVALGRNQTAGAALTAEGAEFRAIDLSQRSLLLEAVKGCDVVFHCAALSSPWGKYSAFYQANVVGTEHVAEAALSVSAKLVHVSTPSVYFDFTDRLNISEFAPLPKPVNHYAATKLMAEKRVLRMVNSSGLRAVILRPRGIFGPHDTVLMPRLIAASKNGRVPLINGGRAIVDVTYVENVVDAMLLAALGAPEHGEVFNISNGGPMMLHKLVGNAYGALGLAFEPREVSYGVARAVATVMEIIASLPFAAHEPKLTRYTAGVFAFDQTLDISRARAQLGYQPRVSVLEGIDRYGEWYRSQQR